MSIHFEPFVAEVCRGLEAQAGVDPHSIARCKTGEDFERQVVAAVQAVADTACPGAAIHYAPGSHAFPDIVVEFPTGERYGIEVKSSSSKTSKAWKINGNSVLGSTKLDVLDTYIIFGKTALGHQAFRHKRYEDAVANVVVTHSPRYLIDMDVAAEETFFAKSGLSYQDICRSDAPIELIKTYFNTLGMDAWWLGESAPVEIRFFSDLWPGEQNALLGYCFAHYPEIFSDSQKKYRRAATWLAVRNSVLSPCLRDNFSASGRVDLLVRGSFYKSVSQVFNTLRLHRSDVLSALEEGTADQLLADWGRGGGIDEPLEAKVDAWITVAAHRVSPKSIGPYSPRDLLRDIMYE